MKPLLAYLIVRRPRPEGSNSKVMYDVASYRDLESIQRAWADVADGEVSAVAHVGYWRPDTESLEEVLAAHPGTVLLTEAARGALPRSFRSASMPCSSAGGLHLYEALSGWGYERVDAAVHASGVVGLGSEGETQTGGLAPRCRWLALAKAEEPDLWKKAAHARITDDAEYLAREGLLDYPDRDALALFRFACLSGSPPSEENILAFLSYTPPWLLAVDINALGLTTRPTNGLSHERIASVADLAMFGKARLLKIPSIGLKSVTEIARKIVYVFSRGSAFCSTQVLASNATLQTPLFVADEGLGIPQEVPAVSVDTAPSSFAAALDEMLNALDERERRVLAMRMGANGAARTLEAIGETLGVTRERVRQLEAKALRNVAVMMPGWATWLDAKLSRLLAGREDPIPLVGLEALDPWFRSAADMEAPLKYILSRLSGEQRHWLLRIDGQVYVTGIDEGAWVEAEKRAKALLANHVNGGQALPEAEARWLIDSLLVGRGEDLRPLLWQTTTRWANFSGLDGGERILVSFGMGAESVVEAVLVDSDRPLHYEEIARRCAERGRPLDVRRAHNAAAEVGFLLARGAYGLDKHVPLNKEEQASVLSEAENMLAENPTKQWHAVEICNGLEERGLDFSGSLTSYIVNYVLHSSRHLVYLGRMIWAAKSTAGNGVSDRIDVWQAMASMLEANGGPMRTEEIRSRLTRDRGLGEYFQLHERDPVVRVGEGTWGLLWRDIPFSEEEAAGISAEMEEIMRLRGSGLHVTEIVGALSRTSAIASRARHPVLLVSLARRTGRMKSGVGGYVYPSDWEGPRRLRASEAVAQALFDAGHGGAKLADIAATASVILRREIPNVIVSRMLISAGGVYDERTGRWSKSETDEADPSEVAEVETCGDALRSDANVPVSPTAQAV